LVRKGKAGSAKVLPLPLLGLDMKWDSQKWPIRSLHRGPNPCGGFFVIWGISDFILKGYWSKL